MQPTTPIGSRTISELPICSSQTTSDATWAWEPKSIAGRPAWIVRARASGIPTSAATRAAISSPRSARAALIAVHASTRCSTGTWRHASNPARAASTRSEEHTSELQSHRDLHSFPTRRSSDLVSALGEGGADRRARLNPLLDRHLAPRLEPGARGLDRPVHVLRCPLGNPPDDLLGGRIDHLDRVTPGGLDPLASDVEAVANDLLGGMSCLGGRSGLGGQGGSS